MDFRGSFLEDQPRFTHLFKGFQNLENRPEKFMFLTSEKSPSTIFKSRFLVIFRNFLVKNKNVKKSSKKNSIVSFRNLREKISGPFQKMPFLKSQFFFTFLFTFSKNVKKWDVFFIFWYINKRGWSRKNKTTKRKIALNFRPEKKQKKTCTQKCNFFTFFTFFYFNPPILRGMSKKCTKKVVTVSKHPLSEKKPPNHRWPH